MASISTETPAMGPSTESRKPRKRFVGKATAGPSRSTTAAALLARQIPPDILNDPLLNQAIGQLPANYSFEIHKTIHHIRKNGAKMVALQMPEGLQMFACTISDIIERFTSALTVIMGDVTYGACCIDDYTALALGCDMLVHYGHSCLVPIDTTTIKTLYVFVEIGIDSDHLHHTVRLNFPSNRTSFRERVLDGEETKRAIEPGTKIAPLLQIEAAHSIPESEGEASQNAVERTRLVLVSTIQFVAALQRLKDDLTTEYTLPETKVEEKVAGLIEDDGEPISVPLNQTPLPGSHLKASIGTYDATIPRTKPLSPGEILGCTAPKLGDVDAIIYLGDGRFHLEAIMIANPGVPAFRYDPYSKKMTREWYDHREMRSNRATAVESARASIQRLSLTCAGAGADADAGTGDDDGEDGRPLWGVILGTLGRQGSLRQLEAITRQLSTNRTGSIPYIPILLSELSPAKLALFNPSPSPYISVFVQTSCPRLSIDWGYAFSRPLLSPYETAVVVGRAQGWEEQERYPMEFYEAGSLSALSRIKGADMIEL